MRYLPNHHKFMLRPKESPNPSGVCLCGCGQKAPIAKVSRTGKGWIMGQPKKFIAGHGPVAKDIHKAFWRHIIYADPNECWLWQGSISPKGYGRAHLQGREIPAHRLSWEIHHGLIPDNLWVLHKCDNPPCCNPRHLFLGTAKDNTQDMIAKGRRKGEYKNNTRRPYVEGELNHSAKVTEQIVYSLRQRFQQKEKIRDLANEFGVRYQLVWNIVHYKTWKHI